jgi:hypothetical protein
MNEPLTPSQRLAVSRARIAEALRDPVWLILLQRWLKEKSKASKPTASDPS